MHLPFFSLEKISKLWNRGASEELLQMDILQTIGYSLLVSAILWLLFRRFFEWIIITISVFDLFVNFYPISVSHPFFKFFFSSHLSPFPFFPWSLYFFVGILASKYLKEKDNIVLVFSVFLCIIQFIVSGASFERIADIGKILLLFELCKRFCTKIPSKMEKFMRASRESLFLYVSHIMIVYGSVLSKGLSFYLGETLTIAEFFGIFIFMSIFLYIIAYFINILRDKNLPLFLFSKNLIYLSILIRFFRSKW